MVLEDKALRVVQGHVKWFDSAKGFGFVVAGDGGRDILLHANVLRNFGQNSIADGVALTLRVQQTPRGEQAVEILSVELAEADETANENVAPVEARREPMVPARVKWFDKGKGFGFANVFGKPDDIFVHVEVLRQSGLADLQPGEAVTLRMVEGARGWMAVQVLPWDAPLRQGEE